MPAIELAFETFSQVIQLTPMSRLEISSYGQHIGWSYLEHGAKPTGLLPADLITPGDRPDRQLVRVSGRQRPEETDLSDPTPRRLPHLCAPIGQLPAPDEGQGEHEDFLIITARPARNRSNHLSKASQR